MKKLAKLLALAFVVVGITACGKMGELENVKPAQAQAIDQTAQVAAPESDIMPHNSK